MDNIMTVKIEFHNGGNVTFYDVIECDSLLSYRTTKSDGAVVVSTGYIRIKQISGRETMIDNFDDISLITIYKGADKKIMKQVQGVIK